LILDKALLAKAKQEGITTAKEQLAQRLEQTIRYLVAQAGSEEALAQSSGKSITALKSELREKLQEQIMIKEVRGQVIKNISATPQEVKSFFETLSVQERPFYPTEVVVRQIVQYPQISEREKAALCEQLAAFRTRIQQGESFEALAREHSQDPGSASKGGEIGFWRLGELAPEYEAAALALEPDELSQPVNTQFGFHLIQLIAREGDRYNSRHILFKPSPEVVDIEVAKTSLTQLRDAILAGKLTFEEAAKTSSEDTTTASAGGLITGKQGEIRMAIDDLSPDVFFAVEQLAQGSISKPVEFTTPDNRQAARILLLEEKRPAHEASLDQDYTKIQELLINKKRVTAFQAWLKDVQASVSIKVAPEYRNCEMLK
ncbi:MAG: peptidylprolyl isomerase, partial [Bacteroidota bacterium]